MEKINIAILDDHQIVIDGLKLLLETSERLQVVLEHTNGFGFLELLRQKQVRIDVVLLDLIMPEIGGLDFGKLLKKEFPEIKIIILSMSSDGGIIYDLIESADISGFVPKSSNRDVLIDAIVSIHNDGQYFTDDVLSNLQNYSNRRRAAEDCNLSSRELEILKLIAKGFTTKQLAETLFISERTVQTHRKNISRKTGTHNVASLLDMAKRLDLY